MPRAERISGPTASTACSETCSSSRTKSRSASPASSNQRYRPQRLDALPPARQTISPRTSSICAPMLWSCRRQRKSPTHFGIWKKQSRAIRGMGPRWLGRRSAVTGSASMVQARTPHRTAAKPPILRGRALQVAEDDPGTLANAAYALAYSGEDIGAMITLVDRAVTLNPSFARGWHISAGLRTWAGQPDIAIEHAEASMRLSPRARVGATLSVIGVAHFFARRFEKAASALVLAIEEDPLTGLAPIRHGFFNEPGLGVMLCE